MLIRRFALYALVSAFWVSSAAVSAASADVPRVNPSSLGFSKARLARVGDTMQQYIDEGKLAGTLTLIARNGQAAWLSAQGLRDTENQLPMTEDTLFRIYSMTKPVTAVAALTLWEQGRFHMHDPIDKYLPQLKDLKVYAGGTAEDMQLVDAEKPVRIIDLFMHTAGFSYGFSDSPVDKRYKQLQAQDREMTVDEMLEEIAKLPLQHQPGSAWHYGINTDIIGFLVEKLTGKKLGEYMQEVIFDPLGMRDTGFSVAAEKASRLAQIYTVGENGQRVLLEEEPLGDYLSDPAVHNGGGGLVSSLSDYFRFAQMLLDGGEYNGVRILGRKTVEYMRSNHLPAHLVPFNQESQGEGYGLAVSVTVDPGQSGFMSSKGNFGWGGAASTYLRIDPVENMILLTLTQFMPIGYHRYHDDFRNLAYQALVD